MRRSRPAFREIYEAHLWDVYGFFGYRVKSRHECEDLTQETFERALRSWHSFDPGRSSPRTWLLTIARNLLIDNERRARGERETPVAEVPEETKSSVDNDRLGLDPVLASALSELGEREREILALRFGGDLTGREIAAITGLTVANVHQILSRTLRRLRESLADRE